jgi:hypothetical protein
MRRIILTAAIAIMVALTCFAEASGQGSSAWKIDAEPSFVLPLVNGSFGVNELFAPAWGGFVGTERALTNSPLALRLGLGYSGCGFLDAEGVSVSGYLTELSLLGGIQAGRKLSARVSAKAFLDAGLGYGLLSTGKAAPYAVGRLGGGFEFDISRSISAYLDASWLQKMGLYGGLGAGLGFSYGLPAVSRSQPAKLHLLELRSFSLAPLFPILRSRYDEAPIGKATIVNTGRDAATDVRVSLFLKQYMDAPKDCAQIARIEPGQSVEVPLYALLNDSILAVTEATKAAAELSVEYSGEGSLSRAETVLVYDRNALTWDDDRKAAAFVSSKDPWVLDLSGNILAACKDVRNGEAEKNIQTAIAFHEGLRAYGLGYVLSPNRPFAQASVDKAAVDSLKFPRQTLGYRSGDCADLSVLYSSFFEAAGIETAFLTVPGHIFMAFDLGLSIEEARARGLDERELIDRGGRAWVPVETTMRDSGFIEIWRKAAAEWHDASSKGVAAFYSMHEAWKIYAPVGLPADGSSVSPPARDKVRASFRAELDKLVAIELKARLDRIGAIPASGPQTAKALNDRGVVYGRYGMLAEAERDFMAASKLQYRPALINLGNIALLRSDAAGAYSYFAHAAEQEPNDARIYVYIAKAATALGRESDAAKALDTARRLDPAIAQKYASGVQADAKGTRAAAVGSDGVDWY